MLRRLGNVTNTAGGILHFQDAPSVVHGRRADQIPGPERRAIGASTADINIRHCSVILLWIFCRARAFASDQALHVWSCHADDELTCQSGKCAQNFIRVFLLSRLARNDHCPCLHLIRVHAGRGIFTTDNFLEPVRVDGFGIDQRREHDWALVNDFAIGDIDARDLPRARDIPQVKTRKDDLRGGRSNIHTDGEEIARIAHKEKITIYQLPVGQQLASNWQIVIGNYFLYVTSPPNSSESMTPTMTASTGALSVWEVNRAEEPSVTRTRSPVPALTVSTATNGSPVMFPAVSALRTMSSLRPRMDSSLIVEMVEPMTSAICMFASKSWDGQIVSDLPVRTYQKDHRCARPGGLSGVWPRKRPFQPLSYKGCRIGRSISLNPVI